MFDFAKEYDKCLVCDSEVRKVVFSRNKGYWEAEITFTCGCVCTIRDDEASLGYVRQCPNAMQVVLQMKRGDIKVEKQTEKRLK